MLEEPEWVVGQRVVHRLFGTGTVDSPDIPGMVAVRFDSGRCLVVQSEFVVLEEAL